MTDRELTAERWGLDEPGGRGTSVHDLPLTKS